MTENQLLDALYRLRGSRYGMSDNEIETWLAQAGYPTAVAADPWAVRKAAEAKMSYLYDEFDGHPELVTYGFINGMSEAYHLQFVSGGDIDDYRDRRPEVAPVLRITKNVVDRAGRTATGSAQGYSNQNLKGRNKISPSEVYAIARNVGFNPSEALTMTAIVGGESNFNTRAFNGNPAPGSNWQPENSVGLSQVSLYFWGDRWTKEQLMDPYTNLQAAYEIYKNAGNSFRPWSQYKNGGYRKYLQQASAASAAYDPNGPMPSYENRTNWTDPTTGEVQSINIQGDLGMVIDDAKALDMYLQALTEQQGDDKQVQLQAKYSTGGVVTNALSQLSALVRRGAKSGGAADLSSMESEADPMEAFQRDGQEMT